MRAAAAQLHPEIPADVAEILASLDEPAAGAVWAFIRRIGARRERHMTNQRMTITPRPRRAPRPVADGPSFWLSTREDPT